MPENSKLSIYHLIDKWSKVKLTNDVVERVHAEMHNQDPDFQEQKGEIVQMLFSRTIKRATLLHGYRFFCENISKVFFECSGDDCFVDLSGFDESAMKKVFNEIVKQFLESQSDLKSDLALKKVLQEQRDYMFEVFKAAFSDLKIINISKVVNEEVSDVVGS